MLIPSIHKDVGYYLSDVNVMYFIVVLRDVCDRKLMLSEKQNPMCYMYLIAKKYA